MGGDSVVELDPAKPPEPKPEGVPLDDSESGGEDSATGGEGQTPKKKKRPVEKWATKAVQVIKQI